MFQKIGSPQSINVLSDVCQICNKNKAEFIKNGKFVCSECNMVVENENKESNIIKE